MRCFVPWNAEFISISQYAPVLSFYYIMLTDLYLPYQVASVLNILDNELVKNVGDYILSCQTYEGGIAGEPGSEAHGGYTFCGLATMILINEADRLDLPSLIDWVVFRQGIECGFQGRANKLVDGCYSFWQGCVFALIQRLPSIAGEQLHLNIGKGKQERGGALSVGISNMSEPESDSGTLSPDESKLSDIGISFIKGRTELGPLFHSVALQQYILLCSQVQEGGFKDKPGKYKDYYHTCYCLSGLSVCQHCWSRDAGSSPFPKAVFGPYSNLLEPIHPVYNLVLDRYYEAHDYFSGSEAS
ncbi:farnesyltransferase subunit beta [Thalictrum thalictroides]|uniref:Farnesyltransferase subunit beta n=1 Tax=Thalictrum thalictroides TaxID=46969 RepID=A0A7J6WEF8_THATH|nr:farnesyltransferase subunit beta [Thalictrum thalictroides]